MEVLRLTKNLEIRLDSLAHLSKAELGKHWLDLFKKPAPPGIRKDLCVRMIAYRIQEQTSVSLSPKVRKRLNKLLGDSMINISPEVNTQIKTGTRLLRDWKGETHEVAVLENGYAYRTKNYKSLSKIACVITGTRWSGPLFFGIKSNNNQEATNGH